MKQPLEQLKNRVLKKKGATKLTALTNILDMAREFGCLGEIIGRDFEVLDKDGNLIQTIRQKPMKVKQLNNLIKEFVVLKKLDDEKEAAKWGVKKGRSMKGKKR